MVRLNDAFEMMLGAENGIHVEFGVIDFVGCCCRCGFRRGYYCCTGLADGIGSTVPGMFFLVRHMWMRGLVHSFCLFI